MQQLQREQQLYQQLCHERIKLNFCVGYFPGESGCVSVELIFVHVCWDILKPLQLLRPRTLTLPLPAIASYCSLYASITSLCFIAILLFLLYTVNENRTQSFCNDALMLCILRSALCFNC